MPIVEGVTAVQAPSATEEKRTTRTRSSEEKPQILEKQSVGQALKQLGILKADQFENIANKLLSYEQPLNKEMLEEMKTLMQQLGGNQEENGDLLSFLSSKNIPLDKELVNELKQTLNGKDFSSLLGKMMEADEGSPVLKQLWSKLPMSTQQKLAQMVSYLSRGDVTENKLEQFTRQMLATIRQQISVPEETASALKNLEKGLTEGDKNLKELLKTFIEKAGDELRGTPDGQKLVDNLMKSLNGKGLKQLQDILKEALPQAKELLEGNKRNDVAKTLQNLEKSLQKEAQGTDKLFKNVQEFIQKNGEVLKHLPEGSRILKDILKALQNNSPEEVEKALAEMMPQDDSEKASPELQKLKNSLEEQKNIRQNVRQNVKEFLQEAGAKLKNFPEGQELLKNLEAALKENNPESLKNALEETLKKAEELLNKNNFLSENEGDFASKQLNDKTLAKDQGNQGKNAFATKTEISAKELAELAKELRQLGENIGQNSGNMNRIDAWKKLDKMLDNLGEQLRNMPEGDEIIKTLEKSIFKESDVLRGNTDALKEALRNKQDAAKTLEQMVEKMSGSGKETLQRIVQDLKTIAEAENLLKFQQVALMMEGNIHQAGIKVNEDGKNSSLEQADMKKLYLHMETSNLGEISLNLGLRDNKLYLSFGAGDVDTADYLVENLGELQDALQKLGHEVVECGCHVEERKTFLEHLLEEEKAAVMPVLQRVDIRM